MSLKMPGWLTKSFEVAGKLAKPVGEFTVRAASVVVGVAATGAGLIAAYNIAQSTGITPNSSWAIPATFVPLGGGYLAVGAAPRKVADFVNKFV